MRDRDVLRSDGKTHGSFGNIFTDSQPLSLLVKNVT